MDFKNWGIEFEYSSNRAVDNGNCHLDFKRKVFVLQLGSKPRVWPNGGSLWSKRDESLIQSHELSHALNLIEELVPKNPVGVGWWLAYEHEKPELVKWMLNEEKRAWRRVIEGLSYLSPEQMMKINDCILGFVYARWKYLIRR